MLLAQVRESRMSAERESMAKHPRRRTKQKNMNKINLGIIGLGGMGRHHAKSILQGDVPNCRLAAVCDGREDVLNEFPTAQKFSTCADLIASNSVDAVLIATPHYSHTTLGIEALQAGLHVLVEKPISVHKSDCERLIAARRSPDQVFAAMFNMRTSEIYGKLRHLIRTGELGQIRRIQWTVTNWFRSDAYYASGKWRATWGGEGGGVLLNQCPHQLDLWYWLFGMPSRIRAFCHMGRYHDIEVEDDVSAYFEYENGATGLFVTSTGEAPGTNRLEVSAERGRVVIENGRFLFDRNEIPTTEFSRTSSSSMKTPSVWKIEIPLAERDKPHAEIIENFGAAILDRKPLIAPAEEGIYSVELANAMLLSTFQNETIELPMNGAQYEEILKKKCTESRFQRATP